MKYKKYNNHKSLFEEIQVGDVFGWLFYNKTNSFYFVVEKKLPNVLLFNINLHYKENTLFWYNLYDLNKELGLSNFQKIIL